MNKKISNKDKKAWQNFVNSKEKLVDKDEYYKKKNFPQIGKSIDLHGYTLEKANKEIEKFILTCHEIGVARINIITGKGSRSKNTEDPYQSKDLSILKYSVPNFIKDNKNLMSKILKIDFDSVESPSKGSFDIILRKKNV